MWGRYYWGRKVESGRVEGVVVIFAWLSSEERHLAKYVDLYASLGWNSLVCHSDFLTLFFPDKVSMLAEGVLGELIKLSPFYHRPHGRETTNNTCSWKCILHEECVMELGSVLSRGSKTSMYKVLQIINGKFEGQHTMDEYRQVKDCVCGHIYDSSPVDFTSDLGTRVLHPSVLKASYPPQLVSWMAKSVAFGLDSLFLNRFEAQHADYWETLYSSVNMGPFLIFCSQDDELSSYSVVSNFARHLQELGGDVKLLKWLSSSDSGHYRVYPDNYKTAVTELLEKAAIIYCQRMRHLKGVVGGCNPLAKSIFDLHRAAMSSNESLRRVAVGPSDHFFLPSSVEYHETKDAGSIPDEQKGALFQLENPPGINVHGVLGKILFDACNPKNVEGWDIKPSESLKGKQIFGSHHRRAHYNPIKCLRRSRL